MEWCDIHLKRLKMVDSKSYMPAENDAPCRRTSQRDACEELVTQTWDRRAGRVSESSPLRELG